MERRYRTVLILAQGFFLDILSSTATKREAKSYLSRYDPATTKAKRSSARPMIRKGIGVNLGNLYLPVRSIDDSPVFSQASTQAPFTDTSVGPLHVALVKIRAPQTIDEKVLQGVARTLSQLSQLGLGCVVVVDPRLTSVAQGTCNVRTLVEQVDKVVAAIDGYCGQDARRVDSVLEFNPYSEQVAASIRVHGEIRVINRDYILSPIRRSSIPVIASVAFVPDRLCMQAVTANEVTLALVREFAGIHSPKLNERDPAGAAETLACLQNQVSLDRLIILDPIGGIPSADPARQACVFINLEQEYNQIRDDLIESAEAPVTIPREDGSLQTRPETSEIIGPGKSCPEPGIRRQKLPTNARHGHSHLENLELFRDCLSLLPPSSSGLLTTAQEAANLQPTWTEVSQDLGVGTRRRRNPLIHNLLTDKPIFSSSLPITRGQGAPDVVSTSVPATFVKRGMPVSIIPDPSIHPWRTPTPSSPSLQLSDPRIDLVRLIHLIEDSFSRKLDVLHYLSRIDGHVAGIIICGEYEGGALLTWESPGPGCGPERRVPYLDKFAVLKRSQGAGGVADIVFKAMIKDCFPNGVCWRSRKDNPVNKWYFERATGSWKIPGSNWAMFWTTEGVEAGYDRGIFEDYEAVCRTVVPSWADRKPVLD